MGLKALIFCTCCAQATAPTSLTGTGESLKSIKDKDGKDAPSTLQTIGDHSAGLAWSFLYTFLYDNCSLVATLSVEDKSAYIFLWWPQRDLRQFVWHDPFNLCYEFVMSSDISGIGGVCAAVQT